MINEQRGRILILNFAFSLKVSVTLFYATLELLFICSKRKEK